MRELRRGVRVCLGVVVGVLVGGCTVDRALGRLNSASFSLWGQPQVVVRSDFEGIELSTGSLEQLKATSAGSTVLRDVLISYQAVRDFVEERGIPDGIRIVDHARQLELMYAANSTAHVFELAHWLRATPRGTRPLTHVEQTAIRPESLWQREANRLRVYLDDLTRLLRIGRPLLRLVPPRRDTARDLGFLVVDAAPGSTRLFGLPEQTRGVIVAYVDPHGPAAAALAPADVLTALGGQRLSGAEDFDLNGVAKAELLRLTVFRGGVESEVVISPEPVPFAIDIHLLDTWNVNAWAGPGVILITTGMMNFCDDDELAFVLGHELGHLANWPVESPKVTEAFRKGRFAPGVIEIRSTTDIALQFLQLNLGTLWLSALERRELELVADRFGIEYARRGGHDPAAALRFLERLMEREDIADAAGFREFLATHPPARGRVQQARGMLQEWGLAAAP
jgi:Zn-dependent protease with chaperone function